MKKTMLCLLSATVFFNLSYPVYAATDQQQNSVKNTFNIHDVIEIGNVYKNEITEGIIVNEVITDIKKDGSFTTSSVKDLLTNSSAYTCEKFETESGEVLTVYSKTSKNDTGYSWLPESLNALDCGDVIWAETDPDDSNFIFSESLIAKHTNGDFITLTVLSECSAENNVYMEDSK